MSADRERARDFTRGTRISEVRDGKTKTSSLILSLSTAAQHHVCGSLLSSDCLCFDLHLLFCPPRQRSEKGRERGTKTSFHHSLPLCLPSPAFTQPLPVSCPSLSRDAPRSCTIPPFLSLVLVLLAASQGMKCDVSLVETRDERGIGCERRVCQGRAGADQVTATHKMQLLLIAATKHRRCNHSLREFSFSSPLSPLVIVIFQFCAPALLQARTRNLPPFSPSPSLRLLSSIGPHDPLREAD